MDEAKKDKIAPYTPAEIAERTLPSMALLRMSTGIGSGFVIAEDGRIATSLHLCAGTRDATIVLADGREFTDVEVVATDEQHDLVVLRISAGDLPALTLCDHADVRVGERVIAIGHPQSQGATVSEGLVSAVRELNPDLTVLQVSAPMGSSGGPLLNTSGEVIGVLLGSVKGQSLYLAMPTTYLKPLLSEHDPRPLSDLDPPRGGRRRAVPHHDLSLIAECSTENLEEVETAIADAISVGAPLYNEGNPEACFRIYQGTALELYRRLEGCEGPKAALMNGVDRAADLTDDDDKAWAMRDAFDGLLDVISRRLSAEGSGTERPAASMPRRAIPTHDLSLLQECSTQQLNLISHTITDAIGVGAPLYNNGDEEACYRVYEAAAFELERKLKGCPGAVGALQDGVMRAAGLSSYKDKAWAMRDTFDGLLHVIRRKMAN